MRRVPTRLVVGSVSVLAVLCGTARSAQDKYTLTSQGGIAFADFRGYEDWSGVSSARTGEVLKVIVANPTMIEAYKAGIDRSLLRENLKRSPEERIRNLVALQRTAEELRRAGRQARR